MSAPKVPAWLAGRLTALVLLAGMGGGAYMATQATDEALRDEYVQAVAADSGTSAGVKVAMVLGSFYESSGKHIGTPDVRINGESGDCGDIALEPGECCYHKPRSSGHRMIPPIGFAILLGIRNHATP